MPFRCLPSVGVLHSHTRCLAKALSAALSRARSLMPLHVQRAKRLVRRVLSANLTRGPALSSLSSRARGSRRDTVTSSRCACRTALTAHNTTYLRFTNTAGTLRFLTGHAVELLRKLWPLRQASEQARERGRERERERACSCCRFQGFGGH